MSKPTVLAALCKRSFCSRVSLGSGKALDDRAAGELLLAELLVAGLSVAGLLVAGLFVAGLLVEASAELWLD